MARHRTAICRLAACVAVLAPLALVHAPSASAARCFGAPPGFKSRYPQPRVFEEAQSWWLEHRRPRRILRFPGAMRANHVHLGLCFPQGVRLRRHTRRLAFPLLGKLHEFRRGAATFVRAGMHESPGGFRKSFTWRPRAETAERAFQGTFRMRPVRVCGRREWRFTLNALNPHHHRRQYQSFGSQAYVPCTARRHRENYRSADIMIFRGWYQGAAEYTNVVFGDESAHRYHGFRARKMSRPVPVGWTVKWKLDEGANHYLVAVDPDVHNRSWGRLLDRGRGRGGTTRVPVERLASGVHRLMVVGCERVRRPRGTACGVGVIPFRVR